MRSFLIKRAALIVAFIMLTLGIPQISCSAATDPYGKIEAENYSSVVQGSIGTKSEDGGTVLGWLGNNGTSEILLYRGVDFGNSGAVKFEGRMEYTSGSKTIDLEIRLDSKTGPVIGSIFKNANLPTVYMNFVCRITGAGGEAAGVTGVHDLYLVSRQEISINWFRFYEKRSGMEVVEAENYEDSVGTFANARADGSTVVTGFGAESPEVLIYQSINFGTMAGMFTARIKNTAAAATGALQIRLDSQTGPLVGSISTFGLQTGQFVTVSCNVTPFTGIRDVYLLSDNDISMNWFQFSKTDPFIQIEAEGYDDAVGPVTASGEDGGTVVSSSGSSIDLPGILVYKYVNFYNGAYSLDARLKASNSNQAVNLEIRLDSAGGPVIGTIADSADGMTYRNESCEINGAAAIGIHDVYVISKADVSLNWIKFYKSRSGTGQIEAENYDGTFGSVDTKTDDGGTVIGWLGQNGTEGTVLYRAMDLGDSGAVKFNIRLLASAAPRDVDLEIRLGEKGGQVIGVLKQSNIPSGYQNLSCSLNPADGVRGVHDVYLVYKQEILINWFQFSFSREGSGTIEAESYDAAVGTVNNKSDDNGTVVDNFGGTTPEALIYKSMNFRKVSANSKFVIRLKNISAGNGALEIRLDSQTGPLAGTLNTGSLPAGAYTTVSCRLKGISGVRDIYLISNRSIAINRFEFAQDESKVKFSYLGNSYSGAGGNYILQDAAHIFVTPDGTVFTNTLWEEGGNNFSEIKNGSFIRAGQNSHGWGYEGGYAVAANSQYVYFAQVSNNESGNLVDPNRWPSAGYTWFGVTRRNKANISTGTPFTGGKGSGTVAGCFLPVLELSSTYKSESKFITGLYATSNELYISDAFNNKILVYDADTMAFKRSWNMNTPGHMTMDGRGYLWIVQTSSNTVLCFDINGNQQADKTITFGSGVIPDSLCMDANGNLLIAGKGINEQILIYGNLSSTPGMTGTHGALYGIYSGTPGEIGNKKFYHISGIGTDSSNNLYVSNGSFNEDKCLGSTFIESYNSGNYLNWRVFGLEWVDTAAADPLSPDDVYTKTEHFVMDYDKPDGQQWTYKGYTINPQKYPDDPRIFDAFSIVLAVRWINGHKFLFMTNMYAYDLAVYRFDPSQDGEVAIPCALFDGKNNTIARNRPLNSQFIWIDQNGNGQMDSNEYSSVAGAYMGPGWEIDANGNVWSGYPDGTIIKILLNGLNQSNVPMWSFQNIVAETAPAPFASDVRRLYYDAAEDVMYLCGQTDTEFTDQREKSAGDTFARFENWSKGNRKPAYVKKTNTQDMRYDGKYSNGLAGFSVTDKYIFTGESVFDQGGKILVYNKKTGELVDSITYTGDFGRIGLMDLCYSFIAQSRGDGKYVIYAEEDGFAKLISIEWTEPRIILNKVDFSSVSQDGNVRIPVLKNAYNAPSCNLIAVLYSGNRMKQVKVLPLNNDLNPMNIGIENTITVPLANQNLTNYGIKVFLVDRLESLIPYSRVEGYTK